FMTKNCAGMVTLAAVRRNAFIPDQTKRPTSRTRPASRILFENNFLILSMGWCSPHSNPQSNFVITEGKRPSAFGLKNLQLARVDLTPTALLPVVIQRWIGSRNNRPKETELAVSTRGLMFHRWCCEGFKGFEGL